MLSTDDHDLLSAEGKNCHVMETARGKPKCTVYLPHFGAINKKSQVADVRTVYPPPPPSKTNINNFLLFRHV